VVAMTGRRRFAHLFRRAGFGATEAEITAAMALHANEDTAFTMAVDNLLNYQAVSEPADRITLTLNDATIPDQYIRWQLERFVRTKRPLLEKMVFWWHGHFATSLQKDGITVPRMDRQNTLFRQNAFGTFEAMLNNIVRDPAMIYWLDLHANRVSSLNENYARELMEVFALGVGDPNAPNYSENDVKEAAKAFTGYTVGADGNFFFNSGQYQPGVKTLLGSQCETGEQANAIIIRYNRGGRWVCAEHITSKLFSFFAYPVKPGDAVVTRIAVIFQNSNLNMRTLVEQILKSPEFSSTTAYRALVKSPVELAVCALRTFGAQWVPEYWVMQRLQEQAQRMFFPPNVAGWPKGREWINASSMLSRVNMTSAVARSMGVTNDVLGAGGSKMATYFTGLTTPTQKVDRVLDLLYLGDVPASSRTALITYASNNMNTDAKICGLFNLAMALPAYQLN
jgi:uncharacterized protein (DUF1800 family)